MNFYYAVNKLKFAITERFNFANKFLTVNYGVNVKEEEKGDPRDYRMGAENPLIWDLMPDHDNWLHEAELSAQEVQRGAMVETMDCTKFGLNNSIQTIVRKNYGLDWNLSNKYPGKYKGTTRNGNTLNNQLNAFKKYGIIFEDECPCNLDKETWNDYHGYIPPPELIALGQKRMNEWIFGWESVWVNEISMRTANKKSPLYLAGYAWYKKGMLYYSNGPANHCFSLPSKTQNIARDSYIPFMKNLAPEYKFYYVKRIYMVKKNTSDLFRKNLISRGFSYVQRSDKINGGHGQVYEISPDGIRELTEQEKMERGIKSLAENKIMTGISEEDFKRLI